MKTNGQWMDNPVFIYHSSLFRIVASLGENIKKKKKKLVGKNEEKKVKNWKI